MVSLKASVLIVVLVVLAVVHVVCVQNRSAPNFQLVGYAALTGDTVLVCSKISSSTDPHLCNSFICVSA
jgi:hypothetical protein